MKLIAAVDNNWAIGNKGALLVRIRTDQMNFRALTTGKVVILGRKTLETFPQKQPLANRTNIILSRNPDYKVKDAIVVHSFEELNEELKKYDTDDVFVIGGESIYKALEPMCDTAIITKVEHSYEADAYFPNLDENPDWECVEEGEEQTCFDLSFTFNTYKRISR
ncbi:MAG: dihydrofolate reductase [Lachnospiraceae bacterium]|nr:dihydrofolate reductase [Lachnospiraceae bacterium]MBR4993207.1 dihydrofolate reductase [Lachnospiraceae bacterium]